METDYWYPARPLYRKIENDFLMYTCAFIDALTFENCEEIAECLSRDKYRMIRDAYGNSPLHFAAKFSLGRHIEFILNCGYGIAEKNSFGHTALILAVAYGTEDSVNALIVNDYTDSALRAPAGLRPLDFCRPSFRNKKKAALLIRQMRWKNYSAEAVMYDLIRCKLHLYNAVCAKSEDLVRMMCANGHEVDEADREGYTAMHAALHIGSFDMFELLLELGADVRKRTLNNESLLHYLSRQEPTAEHVRIMEKLLPMFEDANEVDTKSGTVPLHQVCQFWDDSILEVFIRKGARLDIRDRKLNTVLHYAARNEDGGVMRKLLSEKLKLDVVNAEKDTPLSVAVRRKNVKAIMEIYEHTAKDPSALLFPEKFLEHLNESDFTAVRSITFTIIEFQWIRRCILHDYYGNSLLHFAAAYSIGTQIHELIKCGYDVNEQNSAGDTPLMLAMANGTDISVKALLSINNLDLMIQNRNGLYAIDHCQPSFNNKVKVALLIEAMVQKNISCEVIKSELTRCGLHLYNAVCARNKRLVCLMGANSEGVDVPDTEGYTAMHAAINIGDYDMFELLLDLGADVHQKTLNNESLLHYLARQVPNDGHTLIMEKLLDMFDDVDEVDVETGTTPLQQACEFWDSNGVEMLIRKGARVDVRDSRLNTVLHYAAKNLEDNVMSRLLSEDVDVNAVNVENLTALAIAVRRENPAAIEELYDVNNRIWP